MGRRYYSSRKNPPSLTSSDLYVRLQALYLLFRHRGYFKEQAGITVNNLPDTIKYEASLSLGFQPFPITKWAQDAVTEDHVFDVLEFLHDHTSKPGNWTAMYTTDGEEFYDYDGYDEEAGRSELRDSANDFLACYPPGYELTAEGKVQTLGAGGLRYILDAEIPPYDEGNVDSKVRRAISRWRGRHVTMQDRKEAIRDLADVFEWLKKTKRLDAVLDRKDESALFEIANKFAIRHHDPTQRTNYDRTIWFSWIFHFYLATYHAAIRLLIKREKGGRN